MLNVYTCIRCHHASRQKEHTAELQRLFNNGGYNNNNQGQRPGDNAILA